MYSRGYDNPQFADLYDALNPWGASDSFYLERVMAAESVLDVGCGTGLLLRKAREAGHTGRLVGLDPASTMLDVGRHERSDIEWMHGDLSTVEFDRVFDLVFMTGHVFQEFREDEHLRQTLIAVRGAMTEGGHFAFETRNPQARPWERWTPENPIAIDVPGHGVVRLVHEVETPVVGDLVSFRSTKTSPMMDEPNESRSTLRFLDAASVAAFLSEAGLAIEEQYGCWDGSPLTDTSPEIIVVARRA